MTDSQTETPSSSSRLARIARLCGLAGAGVALVGVVGIQIGLLSPFVGFRLFLLGGVIGGLLALILGVIALVATRGRADDAGRSNAVVGLGFGFALLATLVIGGMPGAGLPAINDITTDLEDPPQFTAALEAPANRGRDMSYPPDFVPQVRAAYADLASIRVGSPPDQTLERALAAGESLGWEITFRDPAAGAFEARDTTALFRFVDDIRVRVRAAEGGSVVDVRSKSRDGKGDVGANAARIRAFARALQASEG